MSLEEQVLDLGRPYVAQHGMKRLAYIEEHTSLKLARSREREMKRFLKRKICFWKKGI